MDPLSAAASIIAVLQLAGSVLTYLHDVHDAPKACKQCLIEISNSNTLLLRLNLRLSEAELGQPWYQAVEALAVKGGPLEQYRLALERLREKVDPSETFKRLSTRLMWTFIKDEVAGIQVRLDRLTGLVNIALSEDHFKLSQAVKEDTSLIRETLPELQADASAVRSAQEDQQHKALLEWLSQIDFSSQHYDIISRRQPGTGQWFLDSANFMYWTKGPDKTLFCTGIPGAGKTMIAAITIDHLRQMMQSNNVEVAYVFCSYKGTAGMSTLDLLAALLRQVAQNRPTIFGAVSKKVWEECEKQRRRPTIEELLSIMQRVCQSYSTVYIVIDALDECTNIGRVREQLVDMLRRLQEFSKDSVRLMYTSRAIPDVTQLFKATTNIEVRADDNDIRSFVSGQIPNLAKCIQRDVELQQLVQDKIAEAVDGMFLLARLYVDSLLGFTTKKKVSTKLDSFKGGSAALDQAYTEALERIDRQTEGYRDIARHALSWITYAERPLSILELCHALAIEIGTDELDTDNISDIDDVVSACAGLVILDEDSDVVRLVHYTTQEFLESVRAAWLPDAQQQIAEACLTYLSFEQFTEPEVNLFSDKPRPSNKHSFSDKDYIEDKDAFLHEGTSIHLDVSLHEDASPSRSSSEERNDDDDLDSDSDAEDAKYPFLHYAQSYWSQHVRPVEQAISSRALAFLANDKLINRWRENLFYLPHLDVHYAKSWECQAGRPRGIDLAAFCGLSNLTEQLLARQAMDSNASSSTPLLYAVTNGHEQVTSLLLAQADVDVNKSSDQGYTPLHLAIANRHEQIALLLLSYDKINVNVVTNYSSQTPLHIAVWLGLEKTVRLLLARDDINVQISAGDSQWDTMHGTPLCTAVKVGNEQNLQLLLSRSDVDVNLQFKWDPSVAAGMPLHCAVGTYKNGAIRLLVSREDLDVNAKDDNGDSPLHIAALYGNEEAVRILFSRSDIDVNARGNYDDAPLHRAVIAGRAEIVRLLMSREEIEVNSMHRDGRSPLIEAVRAGDEDIVQALVSCNDVDVNLADFQGQTPLYHAMHKQRESLVEVLLSRKDIDKALLDNPQVTLTGKKALKVHFLD